MSNSIPPRSTTTAAEREAIALLREVEHWGGDITPAEVRVLKIAIDATYTKRHSYSLKEGATVSKHQTKGHDQALLGLRRSILDAIVVEHYPGLLKAWSRTGAQDQAHRIVNNLSRALAAGLWA